MKSIAALACLLLSLSAIASTGDDAAFQAAFSQVRIGMTLTEVRALGQVVKHCEDGRIGCGPLRYMNDFRTVETAAGRVSIYSYGREQIVFKDDRVILIQR